MGRKRKHEEHVNMEAWVISYADMVTLLFALFVVLYALGEIKLSKLKIVARSVAFAFNFEGEGKTKEPGLFDQGTEGQGQVLDESRLMTAQKKAMKKFLEETLPEAFEEQTGNSLDIVIGDDTISFKAPLSSYFQPNQHASLRTNELTRILSDLVGNSASFTSRIRVIIQAPSVVIGRNSDGTYRRTMWLCLQRLNYLHDFVTTVNKVDHTQVTVEFHYEDGLMYPPGSPWVRGWEERATLEIAFSN